MAEDKRQRSTGIGGGKGLCKAERGTRDRSDRGHCREQKARQNKKKFRAIKGIAMHRTESMGNHNKWRG